MCQLDLSNVGVTHALGIQEAKGSISLNRMGHIMGYVKKVDVYSLKAFEYGAFDAREFVRTKYPDLVFLSTPDGSVSIVTKVSCMDSGYYELHGKTLPDIVGFFAQRVIDKYFTEEDINNAIKKLRVGDLYSFDTAVEFVPDVVEEDKAEEVVEEKKEVAITNEEVILKYLDMIVQDSTFSVKLVQVILGGIKSQVIKPDLFVDKNSFKNTFDVSMFSAVFSNRDYPVHEKFFYDFLTFLVDTTFKNLFSGFTFEPNDTGHTVKLEGVPGSYQCQASSLILCKYNLFCLLVFDGGPLVLEWKKLMRERLMCFVGDQNFRMGHYCSNKEVIKWYENYPLFCAVFHSFVLETNKHIGYNKLLAYDRIGLVSKYELFLFMFHSLYECCGNAFYVDFRWLKRYSFVSALDYPDDYMAISFL